MAEPEERFLARVAWACHVGGLTQGEAAERLGVTRLRVNRALAEARRLGIVRVSLNTAHAPCLALEERLVARFGLSRAYVAPAPAREEDVQDAVGAALGHLLAERLADPALRLLGLSWGRTLSVATRTMEPVHRPDLEVVSVMGGIARGSDLHGFEVTARLARLCGAQHTYLPAPLYAGSRATRDVIAGLDAFAEVLGKIGRVDALALAAGDLSGRSLLVRDGLPPDVTAEALARAGAVGDLLGTLVDARGRPIDHPINERVVGLSPADLAAVPDAILAAGGAHKRPVIRAVLGLGVIDTLVTDEATAAALTA